MDLSSQLIIALLFMLVVAVALWLFVVPGWRRKRLDNRPFPAAWDAIVAQRLPFYPRMPVEIKRTLQNRIKHFIANKPFYGCAGQNIDDDVRVSIAAQASLLLLNRPGDDYADLHAILVYPSEFMVRHAGVDDHGLVSDDEHILAGESWNNGRIVLSWDSVEHGASDFRDGHNVVLHEFAHQLDHQSGATNGAPLLGSRGAYQQWSAVFSEEFDKLQALAMERGDYHHDEVLDLYGATNPAEFFAVATETFFEKPGPLAERHPELFDQLYQYYRVDTREWF